MTNTPASPSTKVLIIEDEALLSDLLVMNLRKAKFDTFLASDAEQAQKALENEPLPDIIILDILLPGMNGFEFLQIIKNSDKLKNIPVIILSNLGNKRDIEKGMSAGSTDYMIKAHILPEDLIKKIKEILPK